MKSLEELRKIKDKVHPSLEIREIHTDATKIEINIADSSTSNLARTVVKFFLEEIENKKLTNIIVTQISENSNIAHEPVVKIQQPNNDKITTYVNVTPEKVIRIVNEHLVNNKIIDEFTLKK